MSTVRTQDGRPARGAGAGQDPAAVRPGEAAGTAATGRHRGAALALGASGATGMVRLAASTQDVTLFGHRVSWLVSVLGLSLIAAAVAYVAGIGAARRLGAKLGSFVAMSEILFAVLFAWVLLGQTPTGMQFLGGALILCGVTLVRLDER